MWQGVEVRHLGAAAGAGHDPLLRLLRRYVSARWRSLLLPSPLPLPSPRAAL